MAVSLKLTLLDQAGGHAAEAKRVQGTAFILAEMFAFLTSAPLLPLYQVALTFIITWNRGERNTLSC